MSSSGLILITPAKVIFYSIPIKIEIVPEQFLTLNIHFIRTKANRKPPERIPGQAKNSSPIKEKIHPLSETGLFLFAKFQLSLTPY